MTPKPQLCHRRLSDGFISVTRLTLVVSLLALTACAHQTAPYSSHNGHSTHSSNPTNGHSNNPANAAQAPAPGDPLSTNATLNQPEPEKADLAAPERLDTNHGIQGYQAPEIDPQQAYTLPELIDLAQRTNPITRTAWLHAEQAATAAGMTRSAYLPFISAVAIAGYQKHHSKNRFTVWDHELQLDTRSSVSGVVPALVLEWLLFDFGKRKAVSKIAEEMALASKFALGAAHQAVIFAVTKNYFQLTNALQQLTLSKENLKNTQYILEAAKAKYQSGIGTSIEVAQAEQLHAQAQLAIVQQQGAVHSSKQQLLSAIGLSPTEDLQVDAQQHPLPTVADLPSEQILQEAVHSRPDVQASQATLRAAQAEIESAKANYYPKIALMGITAGGSGRLNLQGLPTLTPRGASSAIMLGMNIPIFDGGLRREQLRQAQLEAQAAQETHQKSEHDALKEMYLAGDALRTALEAYHAAQTLLTAAETTYDAALEGFQAGLSSMTVLSEAATGLATAKEAHHAAYTAAQIASATLAFAMGELNRFEPNT